MQEAIPTSFYSWAVWYATNAILYTFLLQLSSHGPLSFLKMLVLRPRDEKTRKQVTQWHRERERGVTGMWNKKLGLRVEHLSVYFFFSQLLIYLFWLEQLIYWIIILLCINFCSWTPSILCYCRGRFGVDYFSLTKWGGILYFLWLFDFLN